MHANVPLPGALQALAQHRVISVWSRLHQIAPPHASPQVHATVSNVQSRTAAVENEPLVGFSMESAPPCQNGSKPAVKPAKLQCTTITHVGDNGPGMTRALPTSCCSQHPGIGSNGKEAVAGGVVRGYGVCCIVHVTQAGFTPTTAVGTGTSVVHELPSLTATDSSDTSATQ
jgi:hypothetical protein